MKDFTTKRTCCELWDGTPQQFVEMLARASAIRRRPAAAASVLLRCVSTDAPAQPEPKSQQKPKKQQQQQEPKIQQKSKKKQQQEPAAFTFESLVAPPAPMATVGLRLQGYFDNQELNATSPVVRQQVVQSAAFVDKLQPLLQWGFRNLSVGGGAATSASSSSSEAAGDEKQQARDPVRDVFVLLTPWTNAARDKVWRSFFMRQFFLSGAPLAAFMAVHEMHDAVAPHGNARTREKDAAFLASDLVQEYCARGRFHEAAAAYAQLPLSDAARRDVVGVVLDHEQYASVVHLYRVHRALEVEPPAAPLDPFPLLRALHALKRHDELNREFQQLSPKDQARADIQELMG